MSQLYYLLLGNMENILIVISHPDDWVNGMGGTVLKLKKDYKINVICSSKGERGVEGVSVAEAALIRQREEITVCEKVGVNLEFLDLHDNDIIPDKSSCLKVSARMQELNPVAVFTSWPVDFHIDHIATSFIARKAFHYWNNSQGQFFYIAQSLVQTSQFIPDIYIDISELFEQKLELVRCYKSQNNGGRLVDSVTARAVYYANLGGALKMNYAEGFKSLTPYVENSILAELSI